MTIFSVYQMHFNMKGFYLFWPEAKANSGMAFSTFLCFLVKSRARVRKKKVVALDIKMPQHCSQCPLFLSSDDPQNDGWKMTPRLRRQQQNKSLLDRSTSMLFLFFLSPNPRRYVIIPVFRQWAIEHNGLSLRLISFPPGGG